MSNHSAVASDLKVHVDSIENFQEWLSENHGSADSFWLVRWKKNSGGPYIPYPDLVDVLLCHGWVDSLPAKLDAGRSMLRISPRGPKSNWSATNKKKVERLTTAGLMQPAGLAAVERAKANGRWNFLDDVEKLIVPQDLQKELAAVAKAEYYYRRFPDSSKRGILEWIKNAKTEKTRSKRIADTAAKASKNIKANHPKGRDAGPPDR